VIRAGSAGVTPPWAFASLEIEGATVKSEDPFMLWCVGSSPNPLAAKGVCWFKERQRQDSNPQEADPAVNNLP
jgi:hypothetical protein